MKAGIGMIEARTVMEKGRSERKKGEE